MRNNVGLAIWLTLLMLLLVSMAAVFFLFQRNSELEEDLQRVVSSAEQQQAATIATREHLLSQITVREAALDSASATRDTLAAEAELSNQALQELQSSLAQQESSLTDAQNALQSLATQIFIVSPADGVTVPPLETLDVIATARADSGLRTLSLRVNGEEIASLPADGQTTLTGRASWTPPDEGEFVIGAEALSLNNEIATTNVSVSATFASDEARDAALLRQLETAAGVLRFPAPTQITAEAAAEESGSEADPLHRLLLTGRVVDDGQVVANEAYTQQAFDLLLNDAGLRTYLDSVANRDLLAYFDPTSESLTIYERGEHTGTFGRWLNVHELAHRLQKENLGLDKVDVAALKDDERLAFRALVEGDAAFLQYLILESDDLSAEEKEEVTTGLSAAATDVTAALPMALQDTFEFAYTAGVPFVQFLHDLGGYEAVDSAWSELPASSEQIIHPERYLAKDLPKRVVLAPLNEILGESWRLVGENTFGEFHLRQHLARQPLAAAAIDQAATGWGGGQYAVYRSEDSETPVLVLRLAWDRAEDESEFASLYAGYLERRFGGEEQQADGNGRCWQDDGVGCLFPAGGDSLIIRAPDLETAAAIAEAQLNMSQP